MYNIIVVSILEVTNNYGLTLFVRPSSQTWILSNCLLGHVQIFSGAKLILRPKKRQLRIRYERNKINIESSGNKFLSIRIEIRMRTMVEFVYPLGLRNRVNMLMV